MKIKFFKNTLALALCLVIALGFLPARVSQAAAISINNPGFEYLDENGRPLGMDDNFIKCRNTCKCR